MNVLHRSDCPEQFDRLADHDECTRTGPNTILCGPRFMREFIIVRHWGDLYGCVKALYNVGFRGADLRLDRGFGVGNP